MNLVALQTKTTNDFNKNYKKLKELISSCEEGSFIVAPELCLTGFCYERMDEASYFTSKIINEIKQLSENKTIAISFIQKQDLDYFNTLYIFHNKKIVHRQSKYKLFPLGNEHENFKEGKEDNIKIFEIDGIKVAALICFELRFTKYWLKLLGVDLIINPSMWGAERKAHYETLTNALALANQCYVVAANSANDDMASSSGIVSPWGEVIRDDNKELIEKELDLKEIKRVRKTIKIGLS